MKKEYFWVKCIKPMTGQWVEVDCDGTFYEDMNFVKDEKYRMRKSSNEFIVYPDNEWDGIYRHEYVNEKEFNEHFKIIEKAYN